jgi:prepilin-type N-terminal cleavage/methylation domain-containing protein
MNRIRHAFTLIELLVVIAIIGILSGLVLNMVNGAKRKQHQTQVSAARQGLMILIDNYQSKLNFYPPDSGYLATVSPANYDAFTMTNPLLYELTGATNNDPNHAGDILAFDNSDIPTANYFNVFNRNAVNNGNSDEPHDFFIPGPQPKDYTNYAANISGLLVPLSYSPTSMSPNFWHYDSSTGYRHNQNSYDLWAEYMDGTNIITNANW